MHSKDLRMSVLLRRNIHSLKRLYRKCFFFFKIINRPFLPFSSEISIHRGNIDLHKLGKLRKCLLSLSWWKYYLHVHHFVPQEQVVSICLLGHHSPTCTCSYMYIHPPKPCVYYHITYVHCVLWKPCSCPAHWGILDNGMSITTTSVSCWPHTCFLHSEECQWAGLYWTNLSIYV